MAANWSRSNVNTRCTSVYMQCPDGMRCCARDTKSIFILFHLCWPNRINLEDKLSRRSIRKCFSFAKWKRRAHMCTHTSYTGAPNYPHQQSKPSIAPHFLQFISNVAHQPPPSAPPSINIVHIKWRIQFAQEPDRCVCMCMCFHLMEILI